MKAMAIVILRLIVISTVLQILYGMYCIYNGERIVGILNEEIALAVSSRNCLPNEYIPEFEALLERYEDMYTYLDFSPSGDTVTISADINSPLQVTSSSGAYLVGLENHVQQGTTINVTTSVKVRLSLILKANANVYLYTADDSLPVFGVTDYKDLP